jgi:hypothetical protein
VPRNVGQALLYSPPLGHPRDPPLGHPSRPTLRRAPSIWRPYALRRAPAQVPVCPTHQPGTVAPSGHPVGPLRRATPSLLTVVFIQFQESSSTDHKMHPLSRKLITCSEISSSVRKVHLLRSKSILCLPNSSTMPFLE